MADLIRADMLDDDLEDKVVPEGDYELRIAKAAYGPTKKTQSGEDVEGHNAISLMLVVEGTEGEGAAPVNHTLMIPNDADDGRKKRMYLRDLKRFLVVFGIPADSVNDLENTVTDWAGMTGKVHLIQEEYQGNPQNRVRLPRLASS